MDDFHFLRSQDLITILIIFFTSLLRLSPTDIRMRYCSAAPAIGDKPILLLWTPGVPQGPRSAWSLQADMGREPALSSAFGSGFSGVYVPVLGSLRAWQKQLSRHHL